MLKTAFSIYDDDVLGVIAIVLRRLEQSMMQVSRKVTIFKGTTKYLATSYETEQRASARGLFITFKPKGARNLRAFEDTRSQTVVVEGWDHPEFDELLRGLAEAPVQRLSEISTFQMVSTTVMRGSETKPKYQSDFDDYLKTPGPLPHPPGYAKTDLINLHPRVVKSLVSRLP